MLNKKDYIINPVLAAFISAMMVCIFLFNGLRVSAATGPLVTLERSMDITIIVGYDTEKPAVAFIAPNNKRYEKPEDFDQILEGDKTTYYCISGASSGDWTVEYEKGKNQEITIDVVPWHKNISVDSFSFTTEQKDDKPLPYINGKLNVTYGNGGYNYILSAVIPDADGNITNSIKLCDGRGRSGDECDFSTYTDILPDGEYRLQVEVYAEDNTGVEVRDHLLADGVLKISGNTSAGADECLSVFCNISDGTIDIAFDASSQEIRADEYALIVVQGADGEKLSEQLFNEESFTDHLIFDPAAGDITVQINTKDRDKGYISWVKTFKPAFPLSLEIETPEVTKDQVAVIRFDAGSETYQGRITVGDKTNELLFSGSSAAQVSLETMESNELTVEIFDENITYSESKLISVDMMPPYIDIYGASEDMVTSEDKVTFAGKTDASAITCNGETVQCDAGGAFSFTADMDEDEKNFSFEATDAAGNVTVRNIHITRSDAVIDEKTGEAKEKKGVMPLIITMAISLFLALFTAGLSFMIIKKNEKKGRAVKTVPTVLFSFVASLICCFTGVGIWQLIMHFRAGKKLSGSSLVDLLKNTPLSNVADKIDEKKEYLCSSIISFGIAAGLAVVLIAATVIKRKMKKPDNNTTTESN